MRGLDGFGFVAEIIKITNILLAVLNLLHSPLSFLLRSFLNWKVRDLLVNILFLHDVFPFRPIDEQ